MEEVRTRGGMLAGFVFEGDRHAREVLDYAVELPTVHHWLAPLLQMTMAQLLSYYAALDLGRNIDKPRNLAKSVTVDEHRYPYYVFSRLLQEHAPVFSEGSWSQFYKSLVCQKTSRCIWQIWSKWIGFVPLTRATSERVQIFPYEHRWCQYP